MLLKHVPFICTALDLKTWLTFGMTTVYESILEARTEVNVRKKKLDILKNKEEDLQHMTLEGDVTQQADMRSKLFKALEKHKEDLLKEVTKAERILKRRMHALKTERIEFYRADPSITKEQSDEVEWYVHFHSPRAEELIQVVRSKLLHSSNSN